MTTEQTTFELYVGSVLVETPPHPEDGSTQVIHRYAVEVSWGDGVEVSRCFRHFKGYFTEEEAVDLRCKMVTAGYVTPNHVLESEHWAPHPYADGTLRERLDEEAYREEEDRARGYDVCLF